MTEVVYRGLGFALMVTLFAAGTWTAWTRWRDAEGPWSTRLDALGSLLLVAGLVVALIFLVGGQPLPFAAVSLVFAVYSRSERPTTGANIAR